MAAARDIDPCILNLIRADWEQASHGHKSAVVARWAERIGLSYQTVYRVLPTSRERKGERKIEGLEAAARVVAMYKFMAPDHRRQKVTEDAILLAIENGKAGKPGIDERFADVHPSTFDRVIRDLGLAPKKDRKERFQAERPNQLHHIDGSTSDCFYISERLPDGDYLLKLHKGHKDYKNKPIPVDGLRPWLYGVVDDYSGCWTARYTAACGESALDNIDFLCWAWSQESGMPWFGAPERLMGDKGPMIRDRSIREFLKRAANIVPEKVMPGAKDTHGKVEKIWDVTWSRFEANFFTGDWKHFTITMSELNRRYQIFQREWSSKRKHRFEKKYTRLQMWERINLYGGAIVFPSDALRSVVRCYDRIVDQCGCISIDGETYEIKGLHSAKVRLYKGAFDQQLVAMDLRDGRKYEVKTFSPNVLDEFRGNKKTAHQMVREEAQTLAGPENLLYLAEPIMEVGPRKVVSIQTRVQVRQVENPLDIDRYPDINAALQELQELIGFYITGDDRVAVTALITENGLSRRFVAGLAAEIEHERVRVAL